MVPNLYPAQKVLADNGITMHRKQRHTCPSKQPRSYNSLTTPEKKQRLRGLRQETKKTKLCLNRMQKKVDQSVATSSVDVDEDLDKDIRDMVDESRDRVRDDYPEGSFQRVFWDQQEKAASLKNSKSMRWHPLFIRWCLYLRHLSGEAYEMMRNSKCIYLPSQRTLRDYTHYTTTTTGFSAEVDKQIYDSIDFSVERNR